MRKIKAFLLSLAGKGWLWGTGKEITVNPEYAHLLQENKPPYGFVRTDAMSEVLKKAEEERLKEAADKAWERLKKSLQHKAEESLYCATPSKSTGTTARSTQPKEIEDKPTNPVLERWATTTDPHDKEELTEIDFMCAWLQNFLELPENFDVSVDKDGFIAYSKTRSSYFWTNLPNTRHEKDVVVSFINQHGIENLEWMFKSVTYDV